MKAQLLIDNQWVNAENDAKFERRHPVSNALVTEASSASVADAKKSRRVSTRRIQGLAQFAPQRASSFAAESC